MMKNIDRTVYVRFDFLSFLIFIALFLIEVCIALFVNDRIIRPYGGDFLVVIMIYHFLKAFVHMRYQLLLPLVLVFAYAIELCQLFNIVELLGLKDNVLLRTVIGTSFSWGDMVAYTLGVGLCYMIERFINRNYRK